MTVGAGIFVGRYTRPAIAPAAPGMTVSVTAAGCGSGTSLRESASATSSSRARRGVNAEASLSGSKGNIRSMSGSTRCSILVHLVFDLCLAFEGQTYVRSVHPQRAQPKGQVFVVLARYPYHSVHPEAVVGHHVAKASNSWLDWSTANVGRLVRNPDLSMRSINCGSKAYSISWLGDAVSCGAPPAASFSKEQTTSCSATSRASLARRSGRGREMRSWRP